MLTVYQPEKRLQGERRNKKQIENSKWYIENLSKEHVRSLFKYMEDSHIMNTRSMKINFRRIPLLHVSPQSIARAVANLEDFSAIRYLPDESDDSDESDVLPYGYHYGLSRNQLNEIFFRLSTLQKHKLQKLLIGNNDLSSVPPETVATALCGLDVVNISRTNLTTEHLNRIYTMAAERKYVNKYNSFKSSYINIHGNQNFSSVSRELRKNVKANGQVNITGSGLYFSGEDTDYD